MKVGDEAQVTRTIGAEDLERYRRLGGALAVPGTIPEPLIGGLWSYLLGIRLPGLGTMYLKQETDFHRDAPAGATLTATITLTRLREDKHLADFDTDCRDTDGNRIASGRALVYIRDVQGPREGHADR